jgi:ribosomal 50S subunit-recycling heat shock protein
MRIDNFLSDLGIIKRRTIAKEMADAGHIKINDRRAKPGSKVRPDDTIEVTGKKHIVVRVLKVPEGKSVPKDSRPDYYEVIDSN